MPQQKQEGDGPNFPKKGGILRENWESWELRSLHDTGVVLKTTGKCIPLKTNMLMENPPFEDVFPIENGHFPLSC